MSLTVPHVSRIIYVRLVVRHLWSLILHVPVLPLMFNKVPLQFVSVLVLSHNRIIPVSVLQDLRFPLLVEAMESVWPVMLPIVNYVTRLIYVLLV